MLEPAEVLSISPIRFQALASRNSLASMMGNYQGPTAPHQNIQPCLPMFKISFPASSRPSPPLLIVHHWPPAKEVLDSRLSTMVTMGNLLQNNLEIERIRHLLSSGQNLTFSLHWPWQPRHQSRALLERSVQQRPSSAVNFKKTKSHQLTASRIRPRTPQVKLYPTATTIRRPLRSCPP